MNNQQKSALIHRHFHYHFHYASNSMPQKIKQQTISRDLVLQKRNDMKSLRLSWKDHVDPQVTRLYDEIHQNESLKGDFGLWNSIKYNIKRPQLASPVLSNQQRPLIQSQIQLIKQLEIYQEYLKKRYTPNLYLYVPNQTTFMQKMYEPSISMEFHLKIQEPVFKSLKNEPTLTTKSDIKITQTESNLQMPEQTTSQNLKSYHQKNMEQQNPEFPLFQKSAEQLTLFNQNQTNLDTFGPISNCLTDQKKDNPYFIRKDRSQISFNRYKFQVLKEQCEYLRTKFIQHIETIDEIKL